METGEAILGDLSEMYFDDYSMVAWLSDGQVLRGEKFATLPKQGAGDDQQK